jgi:hypothetical protein
LRTAASSGSSSAISAVASANYAKRRELTLYQTQEACGVEWKHLQKIEAGQLNMTLATLYRLADGFGVSVGDLFAARSRR